MPKRPRKPAYDLEIQRLPQPHRPLIGTDHEIELHGPEAALARMGKRVLVHEARDTLARRFRRGHIAAIAHMISTASLIGLDVIGADNAAAVISDEGFLVRAEPIGQCIGLAHVAIERVGLAFPDHRFQDRPDGIAVFRSGRSHQHGEMFA